MKFKALIIIFFICFSCKNNAKKTEIHSEQTSVSSLSKKERMKMVSEGNQIPNAKIKSIEDSIFEIKSFKGKLLIIDFWATWCAPCLVETPIFKNIAEKYKNSKAEFISISVDQDFADWRDFVLKKDWNVKNYWFGMQENEALFSLLYSEHTIGNKETILMGLPKYVIVSPDGTILSNADLRPSKPEFELTIKKHLK